MGHEERERMIQFGFQRRSKDSRLKSGKVLLVEFRRKVNRCLQLVLVQVELRRKQEYAKGVV